VARVIGIILIVAGALGLGYRSFTYTKETHQAQVGPLKFAVKDTETVKVPVWLGVGAIVLGGVLLLVGGGRR